MSPAAMLAANVVIWLALLGTVVIAVLMGVDAVSRKDGDNR